MKKIIYFISLFFIILFLSGCSYRELNELAISNAIGIDYIDNKYVVTVLVMKLENNEEATSNKTIAYQGSGVDIVSAIRDISLKYPDDLYLGHLELMIIGGGMIDKDIDDTFDYFLRSPEARNDVYLLISEENAYDILKPSEDEEENFPTKDIISTIKNSMKKNGHATLINLEEFISNYLDEGIDPVVSSIKSSNDDKYKSSILGNVAVFKKNKLVGFLNEDSSLAYNIINNNIENVIVNTKCNENIISATVGFKRNSNIKINKKMEFYINIDIEGYLLEVDGNINLLNKKTLNTFSKCIENEINNYIDELIIFNKNNNTDILGFKNYIYKYYNNKYKDYENINIYGQYKINKNINVNIYKYGSINKSFSGGNS